MEQLNSEEWGSLYNLKMLDGAISTINQRCYNVQTLEMLNLTNESDSVLEIGCGTGVSSIALAQDGRKVVAMDYSQECLKLVSEIASRTGIKVDTIMHDATIELPYSDKYFDVIFHAGLLEHFEFNERVEMLKLWRPKCKRMISLVPNAASLTYRLGKHLLEKSNRWQFGIETAIYTQSPEFPSAGYTVEKEYTVGIKEAMDFLPRWHWFRICMSKLLDSNEFEDDCRQGYLLVTVGVTK